MSADHLQQEGGPKATGSWPHSTMETFWADQTASTENPCEVVITADGLSLSYVDDELGPVVYHGVERAPGHWELRAPHGARGSLHGFDGGLRLEGSWSDRGWTGMWTITLSDDPADG